MHFFFQLHIELSQQGYRNKSKNHEQFSNTTIIRFWNNSTTLASFLLSARSQLLKLKAAALGLTSDFFELTVLFSLYNSNILVQIRRKGKKRFILSISLQTFLLLEFVLNKLLKQKIGILQPFLFLILFHYKIKTYLRSQNVKYIMFSDLRNNYLLISQVSFFSLLETCIKAQIWWLLNFN